MCVKASGTYGDSCCSNTFWLTCLAQRSACRVCLQYIETLGHARPACKHIGGILHDVQIPECGVVIVHCELSTKQIWSPAVESEENGVALFGSVRVPLVTVTYLLA